MMGNTSFGFTLTKPPRIQLHAESSKANNKQPDCRYRSWPPCKWCVVWKKALHCQCYWLPITSTSRLMSRSFNLCKSGTFWVLEKEKSASKLQTVIAMKVETYNSRCQIAWFPFLFDQKKKKNQKNHHICWTYCWIELRAQKQYILRLRKKEPARNWRVVEIELTSNSASEDELTSTESR
jgi:hypothetical protein